MERPFFVGEWERSWHGKDPPLGFATGVLQAFSPGSDSSGSEMTDRWIEVKLRAVLTPRITQVSPGFQQIVWDVLRRTETKMNVKDTILAGSTKQHKRCDVLKDNMETEESVLPQTDNSWRLFNALSILWLWFVMALYGNLGL